MQEIKPVEKVNVLKRRKRDDSERKELLQNIFRAKYELECATQNFSYATDPILIDMYTYQIKACQAKYRYLINRAKADGITETCHILTSAQ